MRTFSTLFLLAFVFMSCGGDDGPPPPQPSPANLVFPEQDSECTTGVDISETTSEVEFEWQASANTDSYVLTVTDLVTNRAITENTMATTARVVLKKGNPYAWRVASSNTQVTQRATSAVWQFYNAGSQSNYAPFPARIINPESGASVIKNGDDQVTLAWSGADVDNDISGYEVYFSDSSPPETLVASPGSTETEVEVTVTADTVYYWKIITKDRVGNSSDSGVYQFRAL